MPSTTTSTAPVTGPGAVAEPIAVAWHDVTCPEATGCRGRSLHALSAPLVTSGTLERFVNALAAGRGPGEVARVTSHITTAVRAFHTTFGLAVRDQPNVAVPEVELRLRMLREELRELHTALRHGDVVEVADALGDIVYLAFGDAETYGIDLDAVVAEIQRSNMSKLGPDGRPMYREDGKVAKGPAYFAPDLPQVLGVAGGPVEDTPLASMPAEPFWWDAHTPVTAGELDELPDGTVLVDDAGYPMTKGGQVWWSVRGGTPRARMSHAVLAETSGPLRVMPSLR